MDTASGADGFRDPARWARVRSVLEECLARDPETRDAFVDRACGGDPALEREVRRLLEVAEHPRVGLEPPGDLGALALPWMEDVAGRRMGSYEVLRGLGNGGMGQVFLARRADGAYQRRVAIKVLRPELANESTLERFRRERQVLANLDHPSIAGLIEGGSLEGGAPYLVMEYVEGLPIDRYCDGERLDVRARIDLFLEVCGAVEHAHRHLVVHRDLKPSNILVTVEGRPKLLDFGIAKVLDPEKNSAAGEMTVGVMRYMTPAYASPEQMRSRPVTTASDVYSLGVLLYRLLTGLLPYDLEGASPAEAERVICEATPPRPSAATRGVGAGSKVPPVDGQGPEARADARGTNPTKLASILAGDLDRIVMMALRKEPSGRYPSVDHLAEDLRRYLDGLPVRARSDSLAYRTAKFVRRHRWAVVATLLVWLSLIAGVVASTYLYRRAQEAWTAERGEHALAEERLAESQRLGEALRRERAAAQARVEEVVALNGALEEQRGRAQRSFDDVRRFATTLIFDLNRRLYAIPGTTSVREFVLTTGVDYLDRLAEEQSADDALLREVTGAYLRIAEIQSTTTDPNLGHIRAAQENADKALVLARRLHDADPGDPGTRRLLGEALATQGALHRESGREERASEALRAALEVCGPLAEETPTRPEHLFLVYVIEARLTESLVARGAYGEALESGRRAHGTLDRLLALNRDPALGSEADLVRISLAHVEHAIGDAAALDGEVFQALESLEVAASERPEDPALRRRLRQGRRLVARMLYETGDFESAADLSERNCVELQALSEADPSNHHHSSNLVANAVEWMRALAGLGRWKASLELGERFLETGRTLYRAELTPGPTVMSFGMLCHQLGLSQHRLGLHLDAGQSFAEGREALQELAAREAGQVAALIELARLDIELGRVRRASAESIEEPELRLRALSSAVEALESAQRGIAGLSELGEAVRLQGAFDSAALERELAACRADMEGLRGN